MSLPTYKSILEHDSNNGSESDDDLYSLKDKNAQLRQELQTQVLIFEQYMKVANLQQRKNDLDNKKGIDLRGVNSLRKSRKPSQDDSFYDKDREDEV